MTTTDRPRRRIIRKLFREKRDFWVGQYMRYLSEGLEPTEAMEEVRQDFRDWALTQLAQRLDKGVRWRFIQNEEVRARFEEADGGMFLAMLRGALNLMEQVERPAVGLLTSRGGSRGPLGEFFEAFGDLLSGNDEPEVIEPPSERPTEIKRPIVIDRTRPASEVISTIPQYEAPDRVIEAPGEPS